MKKVIIFDMDGVLINSEPAYLEMNKKLFQNLGINIELVNYYEFVGMSSVKMWTLIKHKFKLVPNIEKLISMERDSMNEILSSSLISEPISGVRDLLNDLREKKFILSVASSSAKENVNLVLTKLKLTNYFKYIVSGEDIEQGKPEPDIFLKVADHFNVDINKCYVIEDSTNGIIASKNAGMKCIGFKNSNSVNQNLSDADLIVENFSEENRKKIIDFIVAN